MRKIILTICILVSPYVVGGEFNYNLDFRGFSAPKLQKMGCVCDTQDAVDVFVERFYSKVINKLSNKHGQTAGIIKANTWEAEGHLGSFNSLHLTDFLSSTSKKVIDTPVVFVEWPEFGSGD